MVFGLLKNGQKSEKRVYEIFGKTKKVPESDYVYN
jgi:hypothetical protein